jgi:hypothetical protein
VIPGKSEKLGGFFDSAIDYSIEILNKSVSNEKRHPNEKREIMNGCYII